MKTLSTKTRHFLHNMEADNAVTTAVVRPGLFTRGLKVTTRWLKFYYECCQESSSYK